MKNTFYYPENISIDSAKMTSPDMFKSYLILYHICHSTFILVLQNDSYKSSKGSFCFYLITNSQGSCLLYSCSFWTHTTPSLFSTKHLTQNRFFSKTMEKPQWRSLIRYLRNLMFPLDKKLLSHVGFLVCVENTSQLDWTV